MDEQLMRPLAEEAMRAAWNRLVKDGGFGPTAVLAGWPFSVRHIVAPVEMVDSFGKDVFVSAVRDLARNESIHVVIITADSYFGELTPEGEALGPEGLYMMHQYKSLAELEAMGLMRRTEAVQVSVQTRAGWGAFLIQQYRREAVRHRDGKHHGEVIIPLGPAQWHPGSVGVEMRGRFMEVFSHRFK